MRGYEKTAPKPIKNIQLYIRDLDSNSKYLARFSSEKLLDNKILMLNTEHDLNLIDWHVAEATPLWNFNLHYLEFLLVLAEDFNNTGNESYYNKFKEILNSWIDNNISFEGAGWQPYTISLRIINILISLELFGNIFDKDHKFKNKVYNSIYTQYIFLYRNQEIHLLGNHYFENLNTILVCSILFDEKDIYDQYIKKYIKEIEEQILADGVHFERSVMYHKIILERLLRTYWLLRQYDSSYNNFFESIIRKMSTALISLEKDMGKIPHFNDSAEGISKNTKQLIQTSKKIMGYQEELKDEFQSAGYYKKYSGEIALLFDVGEIGPPYMPGHGHCDALSFELSKGNQPIFVNSGTYNYQSSLRNFFRSTEAHNTFMIGNTQQSQVWGEHRVAKRISRIKNEKVTDGYLGSFLNYKGDYQERKIEFLETDTLLIRDRVKVKNHQLVHGYLHLAPGLTFERQTKNKVSVINQKNYTICHIEFSNIEDFIIHNRGQITNYSEEFGKLETKNVLEYTWNSQDIDQKMLMFFDNKKEKYSR